MSDGIHEQREALEREANLHRARLLETIDALDRRRHDLLDVKLQIRRHIVPIGVAGGALLLVASLGAGLLVHRFRHRKERARHERLAALGRAFRHPEDLARPAPPNFFAELGRKVLLGTLTWGLMELTRRSVRRALPEHV